jgi:hypothetical protein
MRRTKNQRLRERNIINVHDLLKRGNAELGTQLVCVDWEPGSSGRMYRPRGWEVWTPDVKTDPDAHWMHYGKKFIMAGDKGDAEPFDAAMEFAGEWNSTHGGRRSDTYVRLVGYGELLRETWVPQRLIDAVWRWVEREEERYAQE